MSNELSLKEMLELAIRTGNDNMASEIIKLAEKKQKDGMGENDKKRVLVNRAALQRHLPKGNSPYDCLVLESESLALKEKREFRVIPLDSAPFVRQMERTEAYDLTPANVVELVSFCEQYPGILKEYGRICSGVELPSFYDGQEYVFMEHGYGMLGHDNKHFGVNQKSGLLVRC